MIKKFAEEVNISPYVTTIVNCVPQYDYCEFHAKWLQFQTTPVSLADGKWENNLGMTF